VEDGVPAASSLTHYLAIPYVTPEPGSVIELSNEGSESTTFYELAIEPAGSE
jgi:hypothetical protein